MIKAGVIGGTGYAGQELVRLLKQHPNVDLKLITSKSYQGCKFSDIYNNYYNIIDQKCIISDINKLSDDIDVVFMALPHGIASNEITQEVLDKYKVIDLSADFRIKYKEVYEKWYKTKHGNPNLLSKAVYGLCEWNRAEIKSASLIANPGCYTTCSLLALMPLINDNLIETSDIIIDAKSGVSGAGRSLNLGTHFTECNESIKAYKVGVHRHIPEIEEQLSEKANSNLQVTFTPHLVPMNRGILVTAYAKLKNVSIDFKKIKKCYENYYSNEQFVRLLPEGIYPETRWVKGSNYCDINFYVDERTGSVIVLSALDNLFKGAAGQAVQNMNILFGLNEKEGIDYIPSFPI